MSFTGVHWMGPVYDMGGYGNVSRNYVKAIASLGLPIRIEPVGGDDHRAELGEETARWLRELSTDRIGDRVVSIRHGVPGYFESGSTPDGTIRKVGVTLFETDRLPSGWAEACNRMDEIWVPTAFNRSTFAASGVAPSKLKVVPYPLDVTRFYPGRPHDRIRFSPPLRRFSFLYVFGFDFRKGADLLIRAFCDEFGRDEEVSLVLKIYVHSGYRPDYVMNELRAHIPAERLFTQIFVIIEPFGEQRLIDLYQACDAYVSIDRAGWGMPAMEMMALGKPVVALGWGGYTEFMNETNSLLIAPEPELVPVDIRLQRDRPQYYAGHWWANIAPASIGRAMRTLYGNEELRRRIGRKAAFDIHFGYSPEAIGRTIHRLLQ